MFVFVSSESRRILLPVVLHHIHLHLRQQKELLICSGILSSIFSIIKTSSLVTHTHTRALEYSQPFYTVNRNHFPLYYFFSLASHFLPCLLLSTLSPFVFLHSSSFFASSSRTRQCRRKWRWWWSLCWTSSCRPCCQLWARASRRRR